jgi:uncharacterized membrane protein (UPF0136 family)
MFNPLVGQVTLGIYAILLAAGGVMGFVKANSRPSLIGGLSSALVVLGALGLAAAGFPSGYILGAIIAIGMLQFFAKRFAKNRKFMPGGLMAIVSLAAAVILIATRLLAFP